MAEPPRPPVAIRIVRPYETEDQLLENELETIGKTSVLLIGAHSRPTGVILRFEVTLSSGATLLRGEGRVLAYKENAFRGLAGLSLRFTRLDPRSKALVDRATAIREARGQASHPPPPVAAAARPIAEGLTPPPAPVALAPTLVASVSVPASVPASVPESVEELPTHVDTPMNGGPSVVGLDASDDAKPPAVPPSEPVPAQVQVQVHAQEARQERRGTARSVEAPANEIELLSRLRDRVAKIPPERLTELRGAKR